MSGLPHSAQNGIPKPKQKKGKLGRLGSVNNLGSLSDSPKKTKNPKKKAYKQINKEQAAGSSEPFWQRIQAKTLNAQIELKVGQGWCRWVGFEI